MGWTDYLLFVSHTLTGPGLFALLAFSRVSHENTYVLAITAVSFLLGVLLSVKYPPCYLENRSLFLFLINNSFNLVVTIAVLLNVASQIYPEKGREIALVPVYVLLCSSRLCPTEVSYAVQGVATLLFVVLMVVFVHSERHARPETGVSTEFITILDCLLTQAYAATQGYSGVFYSANDWNRPKWLWNMNSRGSWVLNTQWEARVAAAITQAVSFSLILLSQHAAVFHFLVPRSTPVFNYTLHAYGCILLFACMLLASSWFACLRDAMKDSANSGRAVVRLQHVLYALVIAGAYIFPLQMVELRVILVGVLLIMNAL